MKLMEKVKLKPPNFTPGKTWLRGSYLRRMAFFPLAILHMELVLRLWSHQPFWGIGLLYVFLFSIGAGLVCNLIVSIGGTKLRYVLHWVIMISLTFLFISQTVFYTVFRTYAEINAIGLAQAAISGFFLESIRTIVRATIPIILISLPLIFFQVFRIWKKRPVRLLELSRVLLVTIALHVLIIGSILVNTTGLLPLRAVYQENFTMNLGVQNFGLVSSMRLDIRYTLFGRPVADLSETSYVVLEETPSPDPTPEPEPEEEVYAEPEEPEIPLGYNILEIDFAYLIENEANAELLDMHEFFANRRASPRNEFTGMFEGYNLIWIVGEAYHTISIHPEATPTLYRLSQEGFLFPNFYTPDTGFSTTGGEFGTLLGTIPTNRNAFAQTANNYMPFGFGNLFRAKGYETFAYHNHSHTFNSRHQSHPNLGYPWVALGSGLDIPRVWPASDVEMAQATVEDWIHADHFHVYYLTVSGHLEYNFGGNNMAARHRESVEHLPYSLATQAFLATQMELDLMIAYILDRLEAAGRLEDTVIVLSGDHYPYGLTHAEIEELSGPLLEPIIDVHHSNLIIWNAKMEEPVVVDWYCSFYDIMPTLANLFNLPFDSRLLSGVDLLSGLDPFVPFASRSWISQLGRFNSRTGDFTPHPHIDPATIPEDHAQQMLHRFNVLETYAARILARDYFRVILANQ